MTISSRSSLGDVGAERAAIREEHGPGPFNDTFDPAEFAEPVAPAPILRAADVFQQRLAALAPPLPLVELPKAPPKRRPRTQTTDEVTPRLHCTAEGQPKKIVGNVLTILKLDPMWRGTIAFDAFREVPVLTRQPAQREQDAFAVAPGSDWSPQDSIRTVAWLYHAYKFDVRAAMVTDAVLTVAQQTRVHPVCTYLDGLAWDGSPRVDRFFSTYCGTPDADYVRGVARMLFLSAVARVRRPGCKVDTIPILEGPQGALKSTLLATLAGEWFADTPLMLGDKDCYQSLRGRWIYELAELASLKGRDATRIKSFASSPSDHYRPSYEPRARSVPRQCIFVGTTNESEYLEDATGARRFWPVKVSRIDLPALRRDRDQLWAEAADRFASEESWWPTRGLDALGAEAQADRFVGDPWEGPITAWLAQPRHVSGITMSELLAGALGIDVARQGKEEQARATKILRRAEWTRGKQHRENGLQVRRWIRPKAGDGPGDATGDRAGDT